MLLNTGFKLFDGTGLIVLNKLLIVLGVVKIWVSLLTTLLGRLV